MRDRQRLQHTGPAAELRAARLSVSIVFLAHGILISNWLSRIPAVQQQLGLGVGVLGLVLLGAPLGAMIAMPVTSRLVGRFGSGTVTRISTLLLCAVLPLPAISIGPLTLALALVVYGAAAGAMDVAMNTQASDVEHGYGRPVMVAFHALFSFGGMLGSLTGGFAAGRSMDPAIHLIATGLSIAILSMVITRRLLPDPLEPVVETRSARELLLPLLGLAIISFCILVGEGAMADWSAVYLNRLTGPALAPAGYAVFSLTMALGRLAGDWFHEHLGSVRTVRYGSALAAVGLVFAIVIGTIPATLIGFGCVGLGFSAIFPIVCSVAGRKAAPQPQAGIAAVTATGYFGFLIGPPIIGFLAQLSSLRLALGFVAVLSAVATLLAQVARVRTGPQALVDETVLYGGDYPK